MLIAQDCTKQILLGCARHQPKLQASVLQAVQPAILCQTSAYQQRQHSQYSNLGNSRRLTPRSYLMTSAKCLAPSSPIGLYPSSRFLRVSLPLRDSSRTLMPSGPMLLPPMSSSFRLLLPFSDSASCSEPMQSLSLAVANMSANAWPHANVWLRIKCLPKNIGHAQHCRLLQIMSWKNTLDGSS